MAELLEILKALPMPALVVFAAVLALIFGFRHLGLWQGRNATPATTPSSQGQVVAMIVDPTAINAATAEVAGLSVVMHEVVVVLREAAAQQRRTADELDAVREEMRIHREINRR